MNALGMLVEFGAAGAPADRLHLRHLHDQSLGDGADAVRFRERNARIELTCMLKVPSLKGGRNERGSVKAAAAAPITSSERDAEDQRGIVIGARERRAVAALEHAHQPALMLSEAFQARQHVIGHDRRQRDRDHEARQDRDDVGHAERREQPALDAPSANSGTNTSTMIIVA